MTKRIGILTGGGDCPGLNAAIRAVVKYAHNGHGWSVVGIEDGFQGVYERRFIDLDGSRVTDLLTRGGTILGSSNRTNPFAYPVKRPDGTESIEDVSGQCLDTLAQLDALILVGGDGTMAIGKKMMDRGMRIVGIPKTIDNDLAATECTIGFSTAVDVAVDAIDRLHTTAESHDRVMICEVMGRYAGWIALTAGLASGADAILIPEIDHDIERLVAMLHRRRSRGVSYSIVVVAEGARPRGGSYAELRVADASQQARLGGAGQRLADEIAARTGYDVRVTVLGHIQRGGTPSAADRILATRFGVRAVDLVANGQFGQVAALRAGEIVNVPLELAAAKIKRVDPEGDLVAAARATDVELGA